MQNNIVEVGRGARYGQMEFLKWKVPVNRQFNINCMAVSTSRVGRGEWEFAEILGMLPVLLFKLKCIH